MKHFEYVFKGNLSLDCHCSVCGRDLYLESVYMKKNDPNTGDYFCRDCAKRINAQKKEDEHGNR